MSKNDRDERELPLRWAVILTMSGVAAGGSAAGSAVTMAALTGTPLVGAGVGVTTAITTFFGVMSKMNRTLARR
ncbi:hypothetical protein [Streptomyces nigrescens]|uniref:hypothetical protein n=1 Tax=Streptomyces nigrescens TaxID=1920 RepID=UPI0036A705BC